MIAAGHDGVAISCCGESRQDPVLKVFIDYLRQAALERRY